MIVVKQTNRRFSLRTVFCMQSFIILILIKIKIKHIIYYNDILNDDVHCIYYIAKHLPTSPLFLYYQH